MRRGVRIYKRGDRGFHGYGKPVADSYGGRVEVYESSAAAGPRCWLTITERPRAPGRGDERAVAHLTKAQAEAVIARLQTWIDEIPRRWAGRY